MKDMKKGDFAELKGWYSGATKLEGLLFINAHGETQVEKLDKPIILQQPPLESGDIVCHPKGKALSDINPFNKKEVRLKPLSNEWDFGSGAGEAITISYEEANKYEILKRMA